MSSMSTARSRSRLALRQRVSNDANEHMEPDPDTARKLAIAAANVSTPRKRDVDKLSA